MANEQMAQMFVQLQQLNQQLVNQQQMFPWKYRDNRLKLRSTL